MNVDDIKNIWQEDMNQLKERVQVNEEKIKQMEFNKAQSNFDKFLKISIAGKNMALVYAAISVVLMYMLRESPLYMGLIAIGGVAMVFSYFQHRVLKKVAYASLSIIELQKTIYNFRIHTARTSVYDISIVGIWMITAGVGFIKWSTDWDMMNNPKTILILGVCIVAWLLITFLGGKVLYKDIDTKLKESEHDLESIKHYEMNA
jgi:hypothetical protein